MTLPPDVWSLDRPSSNQRDLMINFWLSAPVDQLESLWSLPFGVLTKKIIRETPSSFAFTSQQISLRDDIAVRLNQNGLSHPLSIQLMIANFLLSPPKLLTINNIDTHFPHWLSVDYRQLYEFSGSAASNQSVDSVASSSQVNLPNSPEFGEFPSNLHDLVADRIHLNRLLGLSNLYYIDPDDQEIRGELEAVRTSLAKAISATPEEDLESVWNSDFGDRYWALIRSGIQSESLSSDDLSIKNNVIAHLNPDSNGGFGTPGAVNAFLIAMMYFLPGTMQVDDAERKIPSWIFPGYSQIFTGSNSSS